MEPTLISLPFCIACEIIIQNHYNYIFAKISFDDSLRLSILHPNWIINQLRDEEMSKKPESKNEALEALDFIVNVLKEHEKDLDRLINDLGTVTEQLGETGELNGKVEKVEEKIGNLQDEVSNLLNAISISKAPLSISAIAKEAQLPVLKDQKMQSFTPPIPAHVPAPLPYQSGPSIILRCKQWEDFQNLASQAQTLSFMYKETERSFQADALKGNHIITYSGEVPKFALLLKMWLSKQVEVPETKILEGAFVIG